MTSTTPSMITTPRGMPRRRKISLHTFQTLGWIYGVVIVTVLAILYRQSIRWSVIAPLIVLGVVALAFVLYLRSIEKSLPYFEIGAFYVAIAFLYFTYPFLKYVLQGYRYDTGDFRIVAVEHRPEALVTMEWWYVLYLISFCVSYALVRGRRPVQGRFSVPAPDWSTIASILLLLTGARLFFVVLGIFFDMHVASYLDSYLVIQRLPHVVRQIAAQVQGIDLTLQIMLVIALTCARGKPFRIVLISFLVITTVSHLLAPGGRISLVAVILAAAAAHHLTIRPLRFRWLVVTAIVGFVALLGMAALRTNQDFDLDRLRERMSDHNEFEVIFGNALDLMYLQDASGIFLDKPNLYWSGLFAIIPQQFLPIAKDAPATWYARTYYTQYYESGGGLAFGVLSEAVAGYGWPEMLWRGALVGLVFALLHRRLGRPHVSIYFFMFYLWLTVWSYMTLRSDTFALLMLFTHRFLPPVAGVILLSVLLPRSQSIGRRMFSRRARTA
jgi:hypothetical protein